MKKMTALLLTGMMVLGAGAMNVSAAEDGAETVNISALNAQGEMEEMEVPYDPQRVAILDFAALDIMDNLGLGDRVVGCASTTLDYLKKYTEQDGVEKLGTIKEADLEAVMACEPDVIFIGGRLSKSYDALSEIAPVVYLATDVEKGVVESTHENAGVIASIFGMEDQVEEKFAGFDERIAALQEAAEGKTAVIGMCTSGSFNVLGNDGRCSIIGTEIGFDNLCKETSSERSGERGGQDAGEGNRGEGKGEENAERTDSAEKTENAEGADSTQGGTATHGNEASFELIVSLNPDYIFVMDRDAAIGTDGAQLARDIMENELVMGTDAYNNGNLVYLENPAVWYTAEGGITALDTMLSDLEASLIQE
ncbi:MAG: ABC transporter substrate-binding protein [Lachnospiraceae bacterium]|nr:ABC transporter substrate-binding protein [Lachnospiraceae bacterium]